MLNNTPETRVGPAFRGHKKQKNKNTPGTRVVQGFYDRTLAVKNSKNCQKISLKKSLIKNKKINFC